MPNYSSILEKLESLLEQEHCFGCNQNTCNISVAFRLGYTIHAIDAFAGSGAASDQFTKLFNKLPRKYVDRKSRKEAKHLCENTPYVECECNAVIWEPEECDYFCDNCGRKACSQLWE